MRYTDAELLELGIRREKIDTPGRRHEKYIYKCATCGRETERFVVMLSSPVCCTVCKKDAWKKVKTAKEMAERKESVAQSLDAPDANKKIRFEKAAKKMERFKGYEAAIRKAETAYRKYGSIPEAVAAIILLHCGYRVIAQQPVSNYTVDFVLPDEKFAIEIDGALYHTNLEKEGIRDYCLERSLGSDWEILHIPAESLMKRPKAFESMIKKRIRKDIKSHVYGAIPAHRDK